MSAHFSARMALSPVLAGCSVFALQAADGRSSTDSYVITATRTLQKLEDTLSSVTIIDREDIERSQARTLDELLAGVEGVAVARQGGIGQPTSVYVRGG